MKFIILVFLLFILLRIVVRYVLPVFRITSMASEQMRRMQQQMKEAERRNNEQTNLNNQAQSQPHHARTTRGGDYIDYEEVR